MTAGNGHAQSLAFAATSTDAGEIHRLFGGIFVNGDVSRNVQSRRVIDGVHVDRESHLEARVVCSRIEVIVRAGIFHGDSHHRRATLVRCGGEPQ